MRGVLVPTSTPEETGTKLNLPCRKNRTEQNSKAIHRRPPPVLKNLRGKAETPPFGFLRVSLNSHCISPFTYFVFGKGTLCFPPSYTDGSKDLKMCFPQECIYIFAHFTRVPQRSPVDSAAFGHLFPILHVFIIHLWKHMPCSVGILSP